MMKPIDMICIDLFQPSKKTPTDPWNIPQTLNCLFMNEILSYLYFGDFWGLFQGSVVNFFETIFNPLFWFLLVMPSTGETGGTFRPWQRSNSHGQYPSAEVLAAVAPSILRLEVVSWKSRAHTHTQCHDFLLEKEGLKKGMI